MVSGICRVVEDRRAPKNFPGLQPARRLGRLTRPGTGIFTRMPSALASSQAPRAANPPENPAPWGEDWCRLGDSNTRPTHYECVALPAELRRLSEGGGK